MTSWDAAYADEIGGDCSALDLPWTTAVRLADIDGKCLILIYRAFADALPQATATSTISSYETTQAFLALRISAVAIKLTLDIIITKGLRRASSATKACPTTSGMRFNLLT